MVLPNTPEWSLRWNCFVMCCFWGVAQLWSSKTWPWCSGGNDCVQVSTQNSSLSSVLNERDSEFECLWARQLPLLLLWEVFCLYPVALEQPHHPRTNTASHTQWQWMSRTRQQALFNLFSSALIGSKLPSLPSWCANECGIEGLPPITPQAHLQDTSGCRAAVCDLYMADEGGARGRKVVSTNLDQRDWSDGKKIPQLIIAVEAWRPYMSAPLLMKFTFTVLQYWSFYDI